MLLLAQSQHCAVVEAIEQREGARAEALMREHSRIANRNLKFALQNQQAQQAQQAAQRGTEAVQQKQDEQMQSRSRGNPGQGGLGGLLDEYA